MIKKTIVILICNIVFLCNITFSNDEEFHMFSSEQGLNSAPFVSLPPSKYLVLGDDGVEIKLEGTIFDDGFPLPENISEPNLDDPNKLEWWWEVTSKPLEAIEPVLESDDLNDIAGSMFVYDNPNQIISVAPNVKLVKPGSYEFSLYASDGEQTNHASMEIYVCPPGSYDYRDKGYLYLSPLPEAEYVSAQTKYLLVRFVEISPYSLVNLSSFIKVTGNMSGVHHGQTKIAGDGRTVIFEMSQNFTAGEYVTVIMTPLSLSDVDSIVKPYSYQFMVGTNFPDPDKITARGEISPDGTKENAFDGDINTKWMDSLVPEGTAYTSWIQMVFPMIDEKRVVDQYALTSAGDSPERDPQNWMLYGVDEANNLTLLDIRTNQTFSNRGQRKIYKFSNLNAFRGYRLKFTCANDSNCANVIQVAEIEFIEHEALFWEYWLNISGTSLDNLRTNTNYPDNPSASGYLSRFETPTNWADNYGTRVRGYLTVPATGSYIFWIASDDNGELWFSTDENPANSSLIASVPGWSTSQEWNKYSQQKSEPIYLTTGQTCYVEALQKEGGGGDNLAVGWAKPGQNTSVPSEVIPGNVLTAWTPENETTAQTMKITNMAGEVKQAVGNIQLDATNPTGPMIMPNGVSVPSNFPHINITINDNPDPEYIFIDNRSGGSISYNVIFDNNGCPVWYWQTDDERRDMKVQKNGVLTMVARNGYMRFIGLDEHYKQIATYQAVNGPSTDEHELVVLENGYYFLIGTRNETVDMRRYVSGGSSSANVAQTQFQEFTPEGDLIFQWRAWDHFDVRDVELDDNKSSSFRFSHMNAIDLDDDGQILISSRHLSEVTKIDKNTGEIIWRLGGNHSDFTFVNDELNGFRNQHAVRSMGNGRYLLFDNGDLHNPSVSRAVEYELDPNNMTATLVWEFRDTPDRYSHYMGNTQRLPNGNTLINWAVGSSPKLTEVRPDGTKAFEMNWVNGYEAYRVWRCDWHGMALEPVLQKIEYQSPDTPILIFNKFGDPNVDYYKIYADTKSPPTTLWTVSDSTLAYVSGFQESGTYYFRVTAVDVNGTESSYSNIESATVTTSDTPGLNLVQNGDFSQGMQNWIWETSSASALSDIKDGVFHYVISDGGPSISSVQLHQNGIKLIQGGHYLFEFDAWADEPRYIEAKVSQDIDPWKSYSKIGYSYIDTEPAHFEYEFDMEDPSDSNSRVVINTGTSDVDVYLDNVSLKYVPK